MMHPCDRHYSAPENVLRFAGVSSGKFRKKQFMYKERSLILIAYTYLQYYSNFSVRHIYVKDVDLPYIIGSCLFPEDSLW